MQFNKEKETAEIRKYISDRIADYKNKNKIKFIELGYQFDQGGMVCVFFDTRENASPDGLWTMNLDGNCLPRTHWPIVFENYDEKECAIMIGNLIKTTLLKLRGEGAFGSLNKHDDCELGIEEINGLFGWPNYEDRGKENLA